MAGGYENGVGGRVVQFLKYVSNVGSSLNSSQARKASQADIRGGTLGSK